jgi:hypothetical protein
MNVLLSHINEEAPAASVLKQWIESSLDRDVHLSGEADNVQLDQKRLAEVDRALGQAQVVLLLCSQRSIGRPWIGFESACAWFKRVPVMVVCHAGCAAAELPPPLGSFPAFDLTDAASCQTLLGTLAKYLKRKRVPRIDCDLMVAEIRAATDPGAVPESPAKRASIDPAPLAKRASEVPRPRGKKSKGVPDPFAREPGASEPASAPASAQPASAAQSQPMEIRLLAKIKLVPDFTHNAPSLAENLEESERTVRHALEKLVNNRLLTLRASTHPTDPETRYAVSDKGRSYLAKHAA